MLREVLGGILGVDGLVTLLPVGRANLAILSNELEGINQTKELVDVTANGGVVDARLLEDSFRVDDEGATESDASILNEHTVVTGEAVVGVSNQGDGNTTETTVGSRGVVPSVKSILRIGGSVEKLSTLVAELLQLLVEGDDLSGAHEGECHGDERKNDPLALELLKGDFLEDTVNNGLLLEGGGGLTNNSRRHFYNISLGVFFVLQNLLLRRCTTPLYTYVLIR